MTKPLGTLLERQAVSLRRQTALKELTRNHQKIVAALVRAEHYTADQAVQRTQRPQPAARSVESGTAETPDRHE